MYRGMKICGPGVELERYIERIIERSQKFGARFKPELGGQGHVFGLISNTGLEAMISIDYSTIFD